MFWTDTTIINPELLSIIIYYNLELTSKYRLNIFSALSEWGLRVKLIRQPWVQSFISDNFLAQSKEHADYLSQLYFNKQCFLASLDLEITFDDYVIDSDF